jgi:hypothetical protein
MIGRLEKKNVLSAGIMGLALLFQGKVTKFSLKKFGLYGHTTFCHSFQIVRGLLLGFVPTPAMQWLNGVLGACAHKTLLSSPLPLFSSAPFLRAAASITLLLNSVCHEPVLTNHLFPKYENSNEERPLSSLFFCF